jgi:hypothetical protein
MMDGQEKREKRMSVRHEYAIFRLRDKVKGEVSVFKSNQRVKSNFFNAELVDGEKGKQVHVHVAYASYNNEEGDTGFADLDVFLPADDETLRALKLWLNDVIREVRG